MKKHGFTLIELLVVISIIAILTTIGVMTYQTVLKQGRDSKRQSDLKAIQSALEQYRSDWGVYPQKGSGSSCNNGQLNINPSSPTQSCPLKSIDGQKEYFKSLPKDPNPSGLQYSYNPLSVGCTNNCTTYELCAYLENPPSGVSAYSCGGISGFYLKVTPP